MTFDQFDQTQEHGWRAIAKTGDYASAVAAIIAYLETAQELEEGQKRLLHFHAAQMYALADEMDEALKHLPLTIEPDELPDALVRWNHYVAATIAFLQGDQEGLLAARERIALGPEHEGRVPNLHVTDRLIANFGKPYSQAY